MVINAKQNSGKLGSAKAGIEQVILNIREVQGLLDRLAVPAPSQSPAATACGFQPAATAPVVVG